MGRGEKGGRPAAALVASALACAVAGFAGCGDAGGDSDEDAIRTVLDQLRSAQDSGDAELACTEIYVIREPERPGSAEAEGESEGGAESEEPEGETGEAGTDECEAAFRDAVAARRAGVSDLSTEVSDVEVEDDTATAIVHTELRRADGSTLSQDVPYDLVLTPEGWRVRIAEEG